MYSAINPFSSLKKRFTNISARKRFCSEDNIANKTTNTIRHNTSLNNLNDWAAADLIYIDNSDSPLSSFSNNQERSRKDKQIQTDEKYFEQTDDLQYRWLISFCDCCIQIAKFYCQDSVQNLQPYFMKSMTGTQYNLFYSVSAYFFILPFFSSYFNQKFGLRYSLLIFCLMFIFGHFIFTLGVSNSYYPLMLFGRFLFLIGANCMEVFEDVIVTLWFFNKELTLSMGLSFAACRVGSALTSIITPWIMIKNPNSLYLPLLIGCLFGVVALFFCLLMIYIDLAYEKERVEEIDSFWLDIPVEKKSIIKLEGFKQLGKVFWPFALTTLFTYTSYFGFLNNSNDLLCTLFGFTPQSAGGILTIFYLISAVITPLMGIMVDSIGKRISLLQTSLFLLIIPFCILYILPIGSNNFIVILCLVMIAVFFSSYAAVLWSCIPLLVEKEKQCLAFGTIYSTLNLCLVFSSFFIGFIHDNTISYGGGYEISLLFIIFCLITAVFFVNYVKEKETIKMEALNLINNEKIREIINEDMELGGKILDMIKESENEDMELKEYKKMSF